MFDEAKLNNNYAKVEIQFKSLSLCNYQICCFMYKDIPDIEPLNDDVQIWKYMDWASFTSLVLNKRLMFRRASFFKDYYDTYVDLDKESINSLIDAFKKQEGQPDNFLNISDVSCENETDRLFFGGKPIQPFYRGEEISFELTYDGKPITTADVAYCCSWHENKKENYALWKIYLGNHPEGVAIKTSVGNLRNILNVRSNSDFYIGKVNYDSKKINIFKDKESNHTIILRKKEEYIYEQEIRIYTLNEKHTDPFFYLQLSNIEDLVEELWVSPFVGNWFFEDVKLFLKNNGVTLTPQRSSIKER